MATVASKLLVFILSANKVQVPAKSFDFIPVGHFPTLKKKKKNHSDDNALVCDVV